MHAKTTIFVIAIALGNCAFGPSLAWAEGGATAETAAYLQLSPEQARDAQEDSSDNRPQGEGAGHDDASSSLAKTADTTARTARLYAAVASAAAASAAAAHLASIVERRRKP